MSTLETQGLVATARPRRTWISKEAIEQAREYLPTFATEFSVMLSQIMVYKLAALHLGKQGFSEYAVARRTVTMLYPILLMGLGVGLPRFLSYASVYGSKRVPPYFGATLRCVLGVTSVFLLIVNLFSTRFAYLFFGNKDYSFLTLPMSALLAGLVSHGVVYAYFRGHLKMKFANILQFINLGVIPLIAFPFFGSNVRTFLLAIGSMTLLATFVVSVFTPLDEIQRAKFVQVKELLTYGMPRVVGDFAITALFTLPVTILVHVRGVQEAGFVAFGITVLSMVGSAFSPISLILLPKASRMFAEGAHVGLSRHVKRIIQATVLITLTLNVVLVVFANGLINVYLGPRFPEVAIYLRLFAFGALPYAIYCVLRGLLDAFYVRPVNTINVLIALSIFLIWSLALFSFGATLFLAAGVVVALLVLAGLTALEVRKILSQSSPPFNVDDPMEGLPVERI